MKRTINSTGRRALARSNVALRLIRSDAGPAEFSASFQGLSDLGLPSDARIVVTPYAGSSAMRFDFGTVGLPLPPENTLLTDLDLGASILFDVRVVDESAEIGRILASVRHLRPGADDDDADRKSLLPVETDDLGELLWKLDAPEGAQPRLKLNRRIPGLLGRLKTDPMMQGCILPAVIAEIIDRLLDPLTVPDDSQEWAQDWLSWISELTQRDIGEVEDPASRRQTVEEICEKFAEQMRFASQCREAASIDPELMSDD